MSARLFVAVSLAEADRAALAGWAREELAGDPGLRLVAPESLHLTLAFLGHRALGELEPLSDLVEHLGGAALAAPILATGPLLWLPARRPKVLAVEVTDEDGGLAILHDELWRGLEALGVARDRRRFRPHVTLARTRGEWPAPARRLAPVPVRGLEPNGVVLLRSFLGSGPAVYRPVATRPF